MLGEKPKNLPKNSEYTRPLYKDENECEYIFDIAEAHDLCYRMGEDRLFFPALCANETPEELPDEEEYGEPVMYRLRYSYLPDSVVHKLMVRCYKRGVDHVEKCWLKGVVLSALDGCYKAVVSMNDDEKTLEIDVYAKSGLDAKPYLLFHFIHEEIRGINNRLNLKAEESISP